MREWYQAHRDHMLLKNQVYRHENWDLINHRRGERYWAVPTIRERHLERSRRNSLRRKRNALAIAEIDVREMLKDAEA